MMIFVVRKRFGICVSYLFVLYFPSIIFVSCLFIFYFPSISFIFGENDFVGQNIGFKIISSLPRERERKKEKRKKKKIVK